MAGRRGQSTADFRPPRLHQSPSTASSLGRYATARLEDSTQSPRPEPERNNTAPTRMRRRETNRTNLTNQTNATEDPNQRAEKKQEQTVDIDNEYFALNPWYNQQKDKPVFGLASPLPRTVRRGMWWGRGDLRKSLYKVDEDPDDDGIDRNDGLDFEKKKRQYIPDSMGHDDCSNHLARTGFDENTEDLQVPLEHEQEHPSHGPRNPDNFRTSIEGRKVNVRRLSTDEADKVLYNRGLDPEGRERAPIDEHGLLYSDRQGQSQHFGMQDGLPPLKELESHETSQTAKEKEEIQNREHEAQQEFYNQYRNPVARLRAQYPQAPAEFLAVCQSSPL